MLPLAARTYGCVGTVRPDERETSPISVRFRVQPGDVILFYEFRFHCHPRLIIQPPTAKLLTSSSEWNVVITFTGQTIFFPVTTTTRQKLGLNLQP
jgi:hypothetical protein